MIAFFPKLSVNASYTYLSKVVSSLGGGGLVATGSPVRFPSARVLPVKERGPVCSTQQATRPQAFALTIPSVTNNWSPRRPRVRAALRLRLSSLNDAAASSKATSESTRIAIEAEKLTVAAQAEALYFNWLRARAQVSIAKNAVERTRARLAKTRNRASRSARSRRAISFASRRSSPTPRSA